MKDTLHLINIKEFTKAISRIKKLIKKDKKNHELYFNLGLVYQKLEDYNNAKLYYEKAISLNCKTLVIYQNLSYVSEKTGNTKDLLRYWQEINKLSPCWELYANIGIALMEERKFEESLDSFNCALKLNSSNSQLYYFLGNLYKEDDKYELALINYNKAIELNQLNYNAYLKIGQMYEDKNKYDESISKYKHVINLNSNSISAHNSLASVYAKLTKYELSLISYENAIKCDLTDEQIHFDKSLIYLKLKKFKEGWPLYDKRPYKILKNDKKIFNSVPMYKGEDLGNKTLYIYPEQGLGDTIMFAPFIKKFPKNVNIILRVNDSLYKLLKKSLESDNIKVVNKVPTSISKIDFHMRLLNILYNFEYEEKNSTLLPYLNINNLLTKNDFLNKNTINIGFVFKGNTNHKNDINRSISLDLFLDFFIDDKKISYYSLQKDLSSEEEEILQNNNIQSLGNTFKDFMDTAIIIEQLDLVISVDTSVAHVSASLGKPTWIILPFDSDWRWGVEGNKCYWYEDHVTLFRQKKITMWDEPMNNIKLGLNKLLETVKY